MKALLDHKGCGGKLAILGALAGFAHLARPIYASEWKGASEKNKAEINKSVDKISSQIQSRLGRGKPSFKAEAMFHFFRIMHQKIEFVAIPKISAIFIGQGKERPSLDRAKNALHWSGQRTPFIGQNASALS